MRQTFKQWGWMLPVLILCIGMSATHLNDDAIWFDEWITYFISGTGAFDAPQVSGTSCAPIDDLAEFAGVICLAAIDNSWPPAFFILLYGWDYLSGGVTFTDRVLALLLALLAVSALYRLGKRLVSAEVGVMSALLLATSAFFVFYAHEVRGYTLYVLATVLSAYCYWLLLDDRYHQQRAVRWAFGLSVALALYSHYIAAAGVLGIAIYHLLFQRSDALIKRGEQAENDPQYQKWLITLKVWFNGCLLYAPWGAVLIISFINESITQRSVDTLTLLQGMVYGFSNDLWWLALPLIALALSRWQTDAVRFISIWGAIILGVSVVGNLFADFLFHPRHIIGMLPAFALMVAIGIHRLAPSRRGLRWVIAGIWVGAGIASSATPAFINQIPRHVSTVSTPAMQTITDTGAQCLRADDLMIVSVDVPRDEWIHDQPLDYYLGAGAYDLVQLGTLVTDASTNPSIFLPADLRGAPYAERVDAVSADVETVWVLSLVDLPVARDLLHLDRLLGQAGFASCGTMIDSGGVIGTAYSRGTCDVSCAE